jgi:hypothetical protein
MLLRTSVKAAFNWTGPGFGDDRYLVAVALDMCKSQSSASKFTV